jgi:hypothetical protein
MNIRLACIGCDTTEADGVKKIPPGWTHVDKLTPRDLKQQELGEWETHQGFCPVCSENAELLVGYGYEPARTLFNQRTA